MGRAPTYHGAPRVRLNIHHIKNKKWVLVTCPEHGQTEMSRSEWANRTLLEDRSACPLCEEEANEQPHKEAEKRGEGGGLWIR